MSRFTKFAAALIAVVGIGAVAQAGHYGCDFGYGSRSFYGTRSYGYSGWSTSRYRSNFRTPIYHDTSHWDYHPPSIYRHRNHFHVQPGHYDWHRTGHWHH